MFNFLKKKRNTKTKGQNNFFILHYNLIFIILIFILILLGFYLLLSATYSTLISPSEPSSADITSNQETINIKQYESVYENLQLKKEGNLDKTIPQLFNES